MMLKPAFAVLPLAALLAACSQGDPAVTVEDPIVRLPAVQGNPGAAYFTLRANCTPMRILRVTSPQIQRIELHESEMVGGRMRMGPLEDNSFTTEGTKVFEEGGPHAMLFGISPEVRAGGTVRLTFDVDNAPDVTVDVPVQTAGGMGGHGH
ncbi:MAG TPA: copper chaperone PCu(A)C [Allosphingosinicella sp.]|nr:copper chaperone PCu(A)C [Allosphingosinicella sp.]